MREFVNDAGGKLAHPGLTSNEIFDLVQLASAAYDISFGSSNYDLADGWFPITADLVEFGMVSDLLKNGYFYEANSFPTDLLPVIYPGTAQAAVFSNGSGDIALAFRGTAEFGFPFVAGDSGDWGPIGQQRHFLAFQNLFQSLDAFIASQVSVNRVLVTGHSLGGAMVERYMDAYPDNTLPGISYEAVAVASPQASFRNDSRVLNIGHDRDIVYSIAGFKGANAVDNIYMLFNDGGFFDLGLSESFGAQHDITIGYTHSVATILSSRFYGETTRDSKVVINYSDQPDDIRKLVDNFFTPDDGYLILGRGADPSTDTLTNIKSGGTLSIDDWLIGGDGDDWLEGFRGDDILEGDVNDGPFAGGNDTMAGGEGKDLFLGSPEDLDGDTIVDLELGDRIGVSGAKVDEETLKDEKGGDTTITFNTKSGLFGIFRSDVSINAVIPRGAGLRLSKERLDDGGSIIEVVAVDGQDVAFVIDTTGSMFDDIASVKVQASSIIDAVFDPRRGFLNSRIAVVGYNDPSTNTILTFTDQTDTKDRKTAALNAINGISVGDGGDLPEMTFGGLLRALDGRAGKWRDDALARKIILFGDATAKDFELAPQVYALARNLGEMIGDRTDVYAAPAALSAMALSESVAMTTFEVMEADDKTGAVTPVLVQIFTVAIGGDIATISEFEEIAAETGGDAFRAADASEIVETILKVINLPIYSVTASMNAVSEGDNGTIAVDVTVRRDVSGQAAIVALSLTGTANEEDRVLASESVSFEADEMQKVVQLVISGDTEFEPDESVIVSIVSISESATVGRQSATVTITNDDLPEISLPVISLAVAPLTAVLEDGSDALIFTFTRKGSTVSPLRINYAVAGTATLGIDYSGIDGVSTSQTITFAAGEDTVILPLDSIADRLIEPDETVSLTLIPGEGYTVGTTTAVSGAISDDDASRLRHSVSAAGDDSFTLIGGSGGTSRLKISLTCAELDSPCDLALFTVDDLQGRINGIDPSDPAYTRVALSNAHNVFSVISNLPQGFNPLLGNRVLELNAGDHFHFLLIKNGTLDTASQQSTGSSDFFLSSIRHIAVSQSSPGQFMLSWKDSLGNGKIRDLRVAIEATDEPMAPGSKLQDNKQGEVFDLSGVDPAKQVRASLVVNREADYNNVLGFYKITDSLGTIVDPLTGATLKPGDSAYTQAALRYRVSGMDLQVANQSTATGSSLMQGGSIFAPFIVANGSPEQLLDSNLSNDVLVYFPFLAANSDGIDHIRLLADNTFGFEDLPGGGDLDYNDMIIAVNFAFV